MVLFADIAVDPASIMAWCVIGLVVAWLVAAMFEAPTYGLLGDIIAGGVGALVGWLVYGFMVSGPASFWVSALFGCVGAVVLIIGARRLAARNS